MTDMSAAMTYMLYRWSNRTIGCKRILDPTLVRLSHFLHPYILLGGCKKNRDKTVEELAFYCFSIS